jgi:hypothetical protein
VGRCSTRLRTATTSAPNRHGSTNPDQTGPQVSVLPVPLVVMPGGALTVLFQISNGGGSFDVRCDFASGASVVGTVSGPDWFMGPYPGTQDFDLANPGTNLNLAEGVVDLTSVVGDVLLQVTFENASNANGGYAILAANLDQPGRTRPGRSACTPNSAGFTFVPTTPGYLVIGGGSFDANFAMGSVVSASDDAVVGGLGLSFGFPMPGGAVVNTIAVDTNGRVLADVGAGSTFTPTVAGLLSGPTAICPLWTDMNPSDPDAQGSLWFHDDGTGASASVTWDRIPQFLGDVTNLNTFQARLFSDGSIHFLYPQLNVNNGTTSPDDVLVGVSPGNGAADPDGESNFGAVPLTVISMDDVVYEFYDNPAESVPFSGLPNDSVVIVESTPPVIGTNFDVDIIDNASATAAAYFFGFPTGIIVPSIPLGPVIPGLAGCEILNDIVTPGAVLSAPVGTPGTPTTIFPIPNSSALVGISGLVVSALVIDPSQSPVLFPTDELIVTIGF